MAKAAKAARIKYMVIEMNPETVIKEKQGGEPIFFGDAAYDAVLEHAAVDRARVMVITVPDIMATRGIVRAARGLNPSLHIIARTRYMREITTLMELGADDVVTEEFESAIEIFTMVLLKYLTPRQEIEQLIAERLTAKKAKDWGRADAIRDSLAEKGVMLKDTPQGTEWSFK